MAARSLLEGEVVNDAAYAVYRATTVVSRVDARNADYAAMNVADCLRSAEERRRMADSVRRQLGEFPAIKVAIRAGGGER